MNSKNKGGASLAYSAARSYSAMVVTTEPDRHIGIALCHLEIIHSAVKCPHFTLLLPGRRAAAVKLGSSWGKGHQDRGVRCPHLTLLLPGRRAAAVKLGLFMGKSASRPRGQVSIFHVAAAGPPRRCCKSGLVHGEKGIKTAEKGIKTAGSSVYISRADWPAARVCAAHIE